MQNNPFSYQTYLKDTVETPAGLIVPTRSAETLIKSEAKKLQKEQNKAAFFSQFALAQNMVAYGAREKPQGTPQFELLYEASKKSWADAIIIQTRQDQMKRIWQKAMEGKNKEVGFRVVHERADDPDFKGSKEIDERCREMEKLISDPTPVAYTYLYPHNVRPHTRLKDLISVLTKSELIIDRKVLLRYKRRDGQGYAAFHWLPGATIKPVDESIRIWANKNENNGKVTRDTIERMSYATGFDIARSAYVQIIDGMVTGAFTDDEISVHISNPSDELNRYGYGTSRLELSLDVTATLMFAWNYNKEMFKTNYPEAILTVSGDFDKEGLAAFKQMVLSEAGGAGNNWRLPIIPGGDVENFKVESHKLRETPKDMLFDQFFRLLLMAKSAAYGSHPSVLNLSMDSGNGTSPLFGGNNEAEIEYSKERGLIPSITDCCEWLTDAIIKPRYDDLKLVVVGLNPEDEKQAVDIRTQRASKWKTKNEARMEEGDAPIGFWLPPETYNKLAEGDQRKAKYDANPWNYPADVPIPNYINTSNMIQQGQQGDEEDDNEDQQYDEQDNEPIQKSQRPNGDGAPATKYLKISIG